MFKITFPRGRKFTGKYLSVAFSDGEGKTESDYLAERFIAKGLIVTQREITDDTNEDLIEKMTVEELKKYAKERKINISSAKNKSEIISVIMATFLDGELKEV